MALEDFASSWNGFLAEAALRNQRLVSELAAAWEDLDALLQRAAGLIDLHPPETSDGDPLAALRWLVDTGAETALIQPLGALQRKRPLARVLSALEEHDAGIDDLVRKLPAEIRAGPSGQAALRALGLPLGLTAAWARLMRADVVLRPRELAAAGLLAAALGRSRMEGDFVASAARASLHLAEPWHILRREGLSRLPPALRAEAGLNQQRSWWSEEAGRIRARAARRLGQIRALAPGDAARLSNLLFGRRWGLPGRPSAALLERRRKHIAYWARLQRAAQSLLDLEAAAARLACDAYEETARGIDSVHAEYRQMLEELDGVLEWLEARRGGPAPGGFPSAQAQLVSAEHRTEAWLRALESSAHTHLPASLESVDPLRPLPGWRNRWRRIRPLKYFLGELASTGRERMLAGLREAEAAHRSVVREIERAREVVAFGLESAAQEGESGAPLAAEAIGNATTLLAHQKRTLQDTRAAAGRHAVGAQAAVFQNFHRAIEQSRFGLLAHSARQRGLRVSARLLEAGTAAARGAARRAEHGLRQAHEFALVRLGLAAPPAPTRDPVRERPRLGRILEVNLGARELPGIYRRLFRLAPVEDPRFLIGREKELAGLEEAFAFWNSGGSASALLVGARGSGKTSLLNCATQALFARSPVVRAQFERRLTGAGEMRAFLAGLLGAHGGGSLEEALEGSRRVVLLEEAERTFLRRIGGLAALRELAGIIEATSRSVFWVISMNETAFQFLKAAAGFDRSFSHQFNAMSVSPAALKTAILQRHHLSGLRLEFAPPAREDPRVSGLRRVAGLEKDPEQLFFDALARQSEGVFRAAYELWQDCIERVEGGVVQMRQPLAPNYGPLQRQLDLGDMFALHAVVQHGCLTAEELAEVLRVSVKPAAGRLLRLAGLEILEPEPASPGFRVRPQAGRFVRQALHGYNLL